MRSAAGAALLRRTPDSAWATAALTAVITFLFVGALLIRDHGDASLVVHAAPPSTDPAQAPHTLSVRPLGDGYDGQFFYRLGLSPFSTAHQVGGVTFDVAALRNARWLMGALAWLFSAGQTAAVPWALLAINVASMIALGAIAGLLARNSGRHAMWGLLVVLYPGFAFSLSLDTAEVLATTFVLGAFYAARRSKWLIAAVLFIAAVLTRDTSASIVAGFALGAFWQVKQRVPGARGQVVAAVSGLVVFVAWQGLQRYRFGDWPFAQSRKANVAGPFTGLAHQLSLDIPPHSGAAAFRLISIVVLIGVVVVAAFRIRSTNIPIPERVAWFPAVAVLVTLNSYLWSGATAFMRAGTEVYVVSAVIIMGARSKAADSVALPVTILWLLSAVSQIAKG